MKKKILFITYNLKLGGTNSALYDLIRLINKEKYHITVFTIHDGGPWEQKFRDAGIRIVNAYTGMEAGQNFRSKIKNRIKLLRIAHARKRMGDKLIPLCIGEKFDITVLQHSYEPYERMPFIPGAKTVRYIHGDAKLNERFREVLEKSKAYFPKYDKIICVSENAKKSFNELYGCHNTTVACYNPLDNELVMKQSMAAIDIPDDIPYICVVGRLAPEKGVQRLVRIHARLVGTGLIHRLVVVGEGPERHNIEKTICEFGVQDSVIMVGYQANPYPYIKGARFTVCPSYNEGLHMVSMESLCLGVPVVASVEPVRELFGSKACGIITNNDDDSLEAGIRKMLEDQPFYQRVVAEAKERGKAFTGAEMVAQIEQVFEELLNKGEA